jgi:hypothetical protein
VGGPLPPSTQRKHASKDGPEPDGLNWRKLGRNGPYVQCGRCTTLTKFAGVTMVLQWQGGQPVFPKVWLSSVAAFSLLAGGCATVDAQGNATTKSVVLQGASGANSGTVYVSRPSQLAGAGLSVDVDVDGKSVGSISNGECMKLKLAAGRHTISGGSTWGAPFSPNGGARPVQVDVGRGTTTFVLITPTVLPGFNFAFPASVNATGNRC